MIYGYFDKEIKGHTETHPLKEWKISDRCVRGETECLIQERFGIVLRPSIRPTLESGAIFEDQRRKGAAVIHGSLFNKSSLRHRLEARGIRLKRGTAAEIVFRWYETRGIEGIGELNGGYILCLWDGNKDTFIIARDQIGIEPLYYAMDGSTCVFGNSLKMVASNRAAGKSIDTDGLVRYLLFNYIPGEISIIRGVKKLRPGHMIVFQGGESEIRRYWFLSFAPSEEKSEEAHREELLDRMRTAVHLRLGARGERPGALLSGGMDSSTVVALMSERMNAAFPTYSFRCRGKTFDESAYARLVADHYGTEHHLIEYPASEIGQIRSMVTLMDEPFCDIGIEVASYLLGKAASGHIDCVLTGDGGDELFAGHPVYLADRMAMKFDRIPRPLQGMITTLCSILPDPESKKSLMVRAKRFAYSYQFPEDVYANRWRIYYNLSELGRLLNPDLFEHVSSSDPLEDIRKLYREADGCDDLSVTLYGDYQTVVEFYLQRLRLLRRFGIEGRMPLLDPDLVRYAAGIPSGLKLKDGSETKVILHRTMAGILPDAIVYRKDKLGHSVPFKNWLRNSEEVKRFCREILYEKIGDSNPYFKQDVVQKMWYQHMRKTFNHSHRLWALVVLLLWIESESLTL